MTESFDQFLSGAQIDDAVYALRPDYRALLLVVDGIRPAPSDADSDALLQRAERAAREATSATPVDELPHVAQWRDAYRAFGAKPARTRNSVEALMRRAETGLPRVNRLTDIYNAISVLHQIPLGGEDMNHYVGSPRLIRAEGAEAFDTVADGQPVAEHPEPGEVVWCDDEGVTCRRWNWRQARRTRLNDDTTTALFILDALGAVSDDAVTAASDELTGHLELLGPQVRVTRRFMTNSVVKQSG